LSYGTFPKRVAKIKEKCIWAKSIKQITFSTYSSNKSVE
jgi:hypothetical protein